MGIRSLGSFSLVAAKSDGVVECVCFCILLLFVIFCFVFFVIFFSSLTGLD